MIETIRLVISPNNGGVTKSENMEVKERKNREKKNQDKRRQSKSTRHTVLLHDRQELDNDLGGRADHNLTLASLLGVVHGVERIVEDGSLDHFGGCGIEILKSRTWIRGIWLRCRESATTSRRAQRVPLP